jgi:predicted ArsR family transcriptional regulator
MGARAAEVEEEYDRLLDAILKGISEHYGDDAINDVLDLV